MNKDMERIKENMNILKDCTLCPRNCHADRFGGQRGRCHETAEIVAAIIEAMRTGKKIFRII